ALQVQHSNKTQINGADILVALLAEDESYGVYVLSQQNMTRLDAMNYLSHGIAPSGDSDLPQIFFSNESSDDDDEHAEVLEKYCMNYCAKAGEGGFTLLVGRAHELKRIMQVLCRKSKNNPLLIGDPGVGKTALIEGLAQRIIANQVPERLKDAVVYGLDLAGLLSGARYRGDFEERLKILLAALEKQPNAILFIDEIHTIIGAGAASGNSLDVSNMLKPILGKGRLRCVGATTYREYRNYFEKDRALERRFQKIDVPEPTEEETLEILKGISGAYEKHHRAEYSKEALCEAVRLSVQHLANRRLPDKAIDIIDEAGAALQLGKLTEKDASDAPDQIGATEIEQIVAHLARIPEQQVSRDDRHVLKSLDQNLKRVVFGQDRAVEALVNAVKLSRAGLREPGKPIGCYLFSGPTGVGKTEMSRQLAQILGVRLKRFDMSEYMERHAVARLIGAPPGYVGFDQGGQLTDAIDQNPHAVLLFDEIEKAHPDIYNILLQVMDHGKLTDHTGKEVHFGRVILIMTTNAGAADMSRAAFGFERVGREGEDKEAIARLFQPEFRNRLDAEISFAPLPPKVIEQVVDKMFIELEAQLLDRQVEIKLLPAARKYFVREGYDAALGARPIGRLISEKVKKRLSEEILFGKLMCGGKVEVHASGRPQDITLKITPHPRSKKTLTARVKA
ncbi:MAG: AAA family ATPase, partial [Alphaproteobacteria bacterium]|nr:AAA family ATPase [Alphaproteobacteria bacterium]